MMKYKCLFSFVVTGLCLGAFAVVFAGNAEKVSRWSQELSAEQQEHAREIIQEFYPRIKQLRREVRGKVKELSGFCYASAEDHEKLARLGKELQAAREALREELIALDARLMNEVGASLHGYRGRHHKALEDATRQLTVQKQYVQSVHHSD